MTHREDLTHRAKVSSCKFDFSHFKIYTRVFIQNIAKPLTYKVFVSKIEFIIHIFLFYYFNGSEIYLL